MTKNIKITIEGWEDEPVVLDNIDDFVLLAQETEGDLNDAMNCDQVFLGYVIAHLQNTFRGKNKGGNQID